MTTECDCVTNMNAKLKDHNARIATGLRITRDLSRMIALTLVGTEKIDTSKRKALPSVVATYCPFCGIKKDLGMEEASGSES